ncbi:hypothetical protein F2Q70_00013931 [Brassica cretica]|uniref:Uncharacterized protein n=1 Tax=Brassica cretica TaxID=69181 RepID=A0A8S9LZH9_BRACR|nr:hypothetical protein F2Q70_00013931 [Brassica cretica]
MAPSNPECYSSNNFQPVHKALPSEESKHELKEGEVKDTIGGTRRSREPTMPSFSDLRRRLPPPLHFTVTVYIHRTVTRIQKTDRYRTTLRRTQNHSRSRSLPVVLQSLRYVSPSVVARAAPSYSSSVSFFSGVVAGWKRQKSKTRPLRKVWKTRPLVTGVTKREDGGIGYAPLAINSLSLSKAMFDERRFDVSFGDSSRRRLLRCLSSAASFPVTLLADLSLCGPPRRVGALSGYLS